MALTAVTAVTSDSLISAYDYHKPSIRNTLFRKYDDQGLMFFNVLDTLGYITPLETVTQTSFSHYEEERIHQTIKVRSNVGNPGAGNNALITLHADDLDSSNRFYPQVRDQILFPNDVVGTIVSIDVSTPSAPVLNVEPNVNADNIGALTADEVLVLFTNTYGEGTDQGEGRVSQMTKYTFSTQIIKEDYSYTGSERTNDTWVDTTSDGKPLKGWYLKGQLDADYRMALQIDGASLFNKATDNTVVDSNTMTGVYFWAKAGGNVDNYTVSSYDMTSFNVMNKQLEKEGGARENVIMAGIDLHTEIEELFFNNWGTNIVVGETGKTPTDLEIDFNSLKKGERKWHTKRMPAFNNPVTYGAAGYTFEQRGLVVPLDKRKDPKSGNHLPACGQRYKAMNGYSRQMEVWGTGSVVFKNTSVDKDEVHMRTERGMEPFAANRYYVIEPS